MAVRIIIQKCIHLKKLVVHNLRTSPGGEGREGGRVEREGRGVEGGLGLSVLDCLSQQTLHRSTHTQHQLQSLLRMTGDKANNMGNGNISIHSYCQVWKGKVIPFSV